VNQHFSGLMLEIMQNEAPALSGFRPDVPRRLAGVIQRAMARDADRRFADVPAFIGALEAVARDDLKMLVGTPPEGVLTRAGFPRPTPPTATELLEMPRRPRRAALWIGGAALLTVVIGGLAVARRRSGSAEREPAAPVVAEPTLQAPPAAPAETPHAAAPAAATPPSAKIAASTADLPAERGAASGTAAHPEVVGPGTARRGAVAAVPVARAAAVHAAPPAAKPGVPARPPRAGLLRVDDF
jgi:hypothetical protein